MIVMTAIGILAIVLMVTAPICSCIACYIVDHSLSYRQAEKSYIFINLSCVFLIIGGFLGAIYIGWALS